MNKVRLTSPSRQLVTTISEIFSLTATKSCATRGPKIQSVCLQCAGRLFYERRMVIVYLPNIPVWAERRHLWRTLTTGLDYLQM